MKLMEEEPTAEKADEKGSRGAQNHREKGKGILGDRHAPHVDALRDVIKP